MWCKGDVVGRLFELVSSFQPQPNKSLFMYVLDTLTDKKARKVNKIYGDTNVWGQVDEVPFALLPLVGGGIPRRQQQLLFFLSFQFLLYKCCSNSQPTFFTSSPYHYHHHVWCQV